MHLIVRMQTTGATSTLPSVPLDVAQRN
jgi:hypothetical protein